MTRTKIFLTSLLLICLGSFIFFQCQDEVLVPQENENQTNYPGKASAREELTEDETFDKYVNTAAVGILELSQDADFRALVYSEAKKAFDGDDNVLLLTLDSLMDIDADNLCQEMTNSISTYWDSITPTIGVSPSAFNDLRAFSDSSDVETAIDGFDYYDEKGYIQIYIPFIDEVDSTDQPVIALGFDDDDETIGYKVIDSDSIIAIMVDEDFAEENLVWVVSVNETVDNNTDLLNVLNPSPPDTTTSRGGDDYAKAAKVQEIYIQHDKDGFLLGKGDMAIIGMQVVVPSCEANYQIGEKKVPFMKLGNKNACKWVEVPSNPADFLSNVFAGNSLINTDLALCEDEVFAFVFYEKDKKKKWEKTYTIPGCSNQSVNYRAKQAIYGQVNFQITYNDLTNGFDWELAEVFDWRIPKPADPDGEFECSTSNYKPEGALKMYSLRFPL